MSQLSILEIASTTLAQARAGDLVALEAVYRTCFPAVHTLVRRLVTRSAVADEITQDVFVQVLRRIDTYAGQGPFGAWVRSIAVSRCLMHLRSPWNRASLWLQADENADSGLLETLPMGADEPVIRSRKEETALECALAKLPPLSRTVVWLHDVEGYTHVEIARELGRSTSFSKSQLARAHERLRTLLSIPEEGVACTPAHSSC